MEHYTEHLDLAQQVFKRFQLPPFDHEKLSPPVLHEFGPQIVVVQEYCDGPAEVDTLSIVGFYIPHDGQCTVAVNHMDGLATLDNADVMFTNSTDPGQPKT